MWGWKPAKRMLELLWNHGELVVAGRQGFQRLYDLPERVLAARVLDAPSPPEPERLRELALRPCAPAARSPRPASSSTGGSGAARRGSVPSSTRSSRDGLARAASTVDDGGPPVLVAAGAELDRPAPTAAVLLSPFDNLLWDRPFARRVLGFDHLIEVYKPAPRAAVRLLRAAAAPGRPDRRAGRPQVGAGDRRARRAAPSTGRTASARPPRSTTPSTARSTGCAAWSAWSPSPMNRVAGARRVVSPSGRSSSTAPQRACSTPCGRSASSSSTRSLPSPSRSISCCWNRLGALRPRRARPPPLGRARALRVARLRAADRGLPLVRALMRRWRRSTRYSHERWARSSSPTTGPFRRYVLRELERRGPLLSRELEDRAAGEPRDHRWYGARNVGLMLTSSTSTARSRSRPAWAPAALGPRRALVSRPPTVPLREAERILAERRFRALGRARAPRLGGAPGGVRRPRARSRDVPLPLRPARPRPRPRRGALGFLYRLEMFVPKAKREYGVLRPRSSAATG